MNPYILTNLVAKRLIVEIDYVEGCRPAEIAIRQLDKVLHEYCEPGKEISILIDNEIPRSKWKAAMSKSQAEFLAAVSNGTFVEGRYGIDYPQELAQDYLSHVPDLEHGTEVVYILYAPRASLKSSLGLSGISQPWNVSRNGKTVAVDGLLVFKETLNRSAILWLNKDCCDRTTLIHEFGHIFGLPGSPEHDQRDDHGHCTNPQCALTQHWRAVLYNAMPAFFTAHLPIDYCGDCREDIRRAKALWARIAGMDPDLRARLIARREAKSLSSAAYGARLKNDKTEAIRLMRAAVVLAPDDAEYHYHLIRYLEWAGSEDEALAAYQEAYRREPNEEGRNELAGKLCRRGRYEEALSLLSREALHSASRKQSEGPGFDGRIVTPLTTTHRAYLIRERALLGLGRLDEILISWNDLLADPTLSPGARASVQWSEAEILRRMGRYEDADSKLKSLKSRYGKTGEWRLSMARLEKARGDDQEMVRLLQSVIDDVRRKLDDRAWMRKANPMQRSFTYSRLAEAYSLLGDEKETRAALEQMNERSASSMKGYLAFQRAEILARIGDSQSALRELEIAAPDRSGFSDPCIEEDLTPLKSERRFRELFPWCRYEPRSPLRSAVRAFVAIGTDLFATRGEKSDVGVDLVCIRASTNTPVDPGFP